MTLAAFAAFGIEIEYMIVDATTFAVRPIADRLLQRAAGHLTGDHEDGAVTWSNELALHVIELKNTAPAPLRGGATEFVRSAATIDRLLAEGLDGNGPARLLPSGMHPLFTPDEFRRWPHDSGEIYAAYDRIFDCRGHGWSNLQSCHVNLPFANDDEFGRLHLACRALLPLLPALAAASPFCEGRFTGHLDHRLQTYRHNQARVPRIAGQIVPEPVRSRDEYYDTILRPIWRDIAPFDPDGLLQEEWLNSRGVVAKFFREALEIRVLDCQESPRADFAIGALVVAAVRALYEERWTSLDHLAALPTERLAAQFLAATATAERTVLADGALLAAVGLPAKPTTLQAVWRHLADAVLPDAAVVDAELQVPLQTILRDGPLARRMLAAVGETPTPAQLRELCRRLADCLRPGHAGVFVA